VRQISWRGLSYTRTSFDRFRLDRHRPFDHEEQRLVAVARASAEHASV